MRCKHEDDCRQRIQEAKDGDCVTCWGVLKDCSLETDLAPGVILKESPYSKLEQLLWRVGTEYSEYVNVYPIPSQLNIRILEIHHEGRSQISFTVPFDVMGENTEESVRARIAATCKSRIEWLSTFANPRKATIIEGIE